MWSAVTTKTANLWLINYVPMWSAATSKTSFWWSKNYVPMWSTVKKGYYLRTVCCPASSLNRSSVVLLLAEVFPRPVKKVV